MHTEYYNDATTGGCTPRRICTQSAATFSSQLYSTTTDITTTTTTAITATTDPLCSARAACLPACQPHSIQFMLFCIHFFSCPAPAPHPWRSLAPLPKWFIQDAPAAAAAAASASLCLLLPRDTRAQERSNSTISETLLRDETNSGAFKNIFKKNFPFPPGCILSSEQCHQTRALK